MKHEKSVPVIWIALMKNFHGYYNIFTFMLRVCNNSLSILYSSVYIYSYFLTFGDFAWGYGNENVENGHKKSHLWIFLLKRSPKRYFYIQHLANPCVLPTNGIFLIYENKLHTLFNSSITAVSFTFLDNSVKSLFFSFHSFILSCLSFIYSFSFSDKTSEICISISFI